mgnify:CR=1 FL=1
MKLSIIKTTIVFISLFSYIYLNSQSYIKPMGNGTTYPVSCTCKDSLGNLYAVQQRQFNSDTILIQKWSTTNNTWTNFTRLINYNIYPSISKTTCNFYANKLYLTALDNNFKLNLMEFDGNIWKAITIFSINYNSFWTAIHSHVFKNKLYFIGGFDSIGGNSMPNVAIFNGNTFTNENFPSQFLTDGTFESHIESNKDTMFFTSNNKIIRHIYPNTWTNIFTTKNNSYENLQSIALLNNNIFTINNSKLYQLNQNGILLDSFTTIDFKPKLKSINEKLFIVSRNGKLKYFKNNQFKYLDINEVNDSNFISFNVVNNKLFYYGSKGVKINGVDYNNIIEIDPDSAIGVGYDTIRCFVFWDKNNNLIKDKNDITPNSFTNVFNITSNKYMINLDSGKLIDYVLENQNQEYRLEYYQFDSCVSFKPNSNITTNNSSLSKSNDSIYFPLSKKTNAPYNLVVKNTSSNRARLMVETELSINVEHYHCYFGTISNGSVKVTLDPNTTFKSSTPAYTSKNGNEYTFSNLAISYYQANVIKIKVEYDINKFKVGEKVKHYIELGALANEDPKDNKDSIVQNLVYSYDPNCKNSIPEGKITSDVKTIRYYIHFQNEGNDDAHTVTIVDSLFLNLPVYEFQMVHSTHPFQVSIQPGTNTVKWIFNNIYLKPKSTNEELSKGYIVFDAKMKNNLKIGDSIRNNANIYFDYNSPITTNFAVITRIEKVNVNTNTIHTNKELSLYPNPATYNLTISNNSQIPTYFKIYDLKGSLISQGYISQNNSTSINVNNWMSGLYLLVNEKGESIKFFIE